MFFSKISKLILKNIKKTLKVKTNKKTSFEVKNNRITNYKLSNLKLENNNFFKNILKLSDYSHNINFFLKLINSFFFTYIGNLYHYDIFGFNLLYIFIFITTIIFLPLFIYESGKDYINNLLYLNLFINMFFFFFFL